MPNPRIPAAGGALLAPLIRIVRLRLAITMLRLARILADRGSRIIHHYEGKGR